MLYKTVRTTASQFVALILCVAFSVMIFIWSPISARGVKNGLKLCGDIIIPSLFPFTVLTCFLQKSGGLEPIQKIMTPVTDKLFGLSGKEFGVFLLSCISGYPVGARLICDMYVNGEISAKKAHSMLTYCINGGPAFIVVAVGSGILGSMSLGCRLLICHLLSSFVIMCITANLTREKDRPATKTEPLALSDAFVLSTVAGCNTMLPVCGYVVLFSVITSLIDTVFSNCSLTDKILPLLEVTLGIYGSGEKGNIYMISFLLGFGGLSVLFQVMSGCRELRPNFIVLLISRIIHGGISSIFMKLSLIIIPQTVAAMANNLEIRGFADTPWLSAALFFMCIVFMCFTSQKLYVEKDNTI